MKIIEISEVEQNSNIKNEIRSYLTNLISNRVEDLSIEIAENLTPEFINSHFTNYNLEWCKNEWNKDYEDKWIKCENGFTKQLVDLIMTALFYYK